jgi:hypothetical protein
MNTHKEAHKQHTGPAKTFGCPFCLNIQRAERATRRDALVLAIVNLEVAVDDYTFGVFVNVTNPDPEDVPVSTLKAAVIAASTEVAHQMNIADVTLVSSAYAEVVIPSEIRAQAADAEIAALRHARSERARKALAQPAIVRDCSCCGMNFYRTADGGCTFCNGKQVCCRN